MPCGTVRAAPPRAHRIADKGKGRIVYELLGHGGNGGAHSRVPGLEQGVGDTLGDGVGLAAPHQRRALWQEALGKAGTDAELAMHLA